MDFGVARGVFAAVVYEHTQRASFNFSNKQKKMLKQTRNGRFFWAVRYFQCVSLCVFAEVWKEIRFIFVLCARTFFIVSLEAQ